MRPDEHKKKKSAQYNKKKAAKDGRKDNKSAVGSGKGDQTNRTPVNSKVQQQHTTASSAPARSSDSSDTEEPTVTKQRPTFKRREIVSNWNRYEITEGDSDSLVQPLPDYSKLLSSAGGASSHFRFKDEADWEGDLSSITEDTQMTSALDLDLTDLGEAMQSIPLYDRLSVPPGLFTEEQKIEMRRVADACGVEYGSMRDADYAERLAPEAGDTCESIASVNNSHSGTCNPSGNRVCSTSSELGQDVNTLNSLNKDDTNKESTLCTLDCKAVSPHESFSEQANRKERSSEQRKVSSEQMKSVQQSKDVNKQSGVHRVLTTPHQEEELDILLSIGETNSSTTTLDPSVSRQHESTSDRLNSKLSDSCKDEGNSCRRQPDLLVNSPGNSQVHQHKTDPLVEKKPELENLEDWLDSILDD